VCPDDALELVLRLPISSVRRVLDAGRLRIAPSSCCDGSCARATREQREHDEHITTASRKVSAAAALQAAPRAAPGASEQAPLCAMEEGQQPSDQRLINA